MAEAEGSADNKLTDAADAPAEDRSGVEGAQADGEAAEASNGSAEKGERDGGATGGQGLSANPFVKAMAHIKWATFLQRAERYDRAVEHFESSIELLPSARAYFGLGTCLASLRRRLEAENAFREAIRIKPNLVGAHINLASVLQARRSFEESATHCRKALELEPRSREAVMNLANVLRNLGRRDEAVDLVWEKIFAEQERPQTEEGDVPSETSAVLQPSLLECSKWQAKMLEDGGGGSSGSRCEGAKQLAVVCVKWGKRYESAYVNRLCAGVRRHLKDSNVPFICFTDDSTGLDESIEARSLPTNLPLWWGKAFLFSEEAGLDGYRVLFLDLDQIIVGDLKDLAEYRGPFALLATDGIACELAGGGYNSSVMAWEASDFFRPIFTKLNAAVLKFVHRFDHWLEMNVKDADLWQKIAPGRVIDYTTAFRGGTCIGMAEEELVANGAFAAPTEVEKDVKACDVKTGGGGDEPSSEEDPPAGAAVVTFPRSPKPHEVLEQHEWVRRHWLGEDG
eukprot:TRINITY_DN26661_c0_g1_i1.p1 TRINITY_DN26661_c0_g1~~TRINITY_DN26661_c0_g1_i1.p1  ORF type:complete len:511 (+),score=107.86 TRINITY_DN26661_c0_g1_i1:91-1623(+)